MSKPIPIGVSPRHLHLAKEDFIRLFGEEAFLTRRSDLSQKGQFAAEQTVSLATAVGKIDGVRILGPFRDNTQVEISASDAFALGLKPPVRDSGKHNGTPGITIIGPNGTIELEQGVILAQRHIHMTPAQAKEYGAQDKDIVWAAVKCEPLLNSAGREIIFGDVIVRVDPAYRLDFHLDTDEANAAGVFDPSKAKAYIIKDFDDKGASEKDLYERKRVYSEWDVRKAQAEGKRILLEKGTILTPSAADYGRKWNIFIYV